MVNWRPVAFRLTFRLGVIEIGSAALSIIPITTGRESREK